MCREKKRAKNEDGEEEGCTGRATERNPGELIMRGRARKRKKKKNERCENVKDQGLRSYQPAELNDE